MVCIVCLLPLFLLPLINYLPQLYDKIMTFMYPLFGKQYVAPVREAPACPVKPRVKTMKADNLDEVTNGRSESNPLLASDLKTE